MTDRVSIIADVLVDYGVGIPGTDSHRLECEDLSACECTLEAAREVHEALLRAEESGPGPVRPKWFLRLGEALLYGGLGKRDVGGHLD